MLVTSPQHLCAQAVLERTLRSYTCLTVGDCFVVNYNNKNYEIEVCTCKARAMYAGAQPPRSTASMWVPGAAVSALQYVLIHEVDRNTHHCNVS
jgi:hypothetical protein